MPERGIPRIKEIRPSLTIYNLRNSNATLEESQIINVCNRSDILVSKINVERICNYINIGLAFSP